MALSVPDVVVLLADDRIPNRRGRKPDSRRHSSKAPPRDNSATGAVCSPQAPEPNMPLLRAFLACELPPALQSAIETETAGMRLALGPDSIRWVPAQQIHLTLKFLGDVSPSNLDPVRNMLATQAAACQPFRIRVAGFGAFPNLRRPRVIWAALSAPPELAELQRSLEVDSSRLGYPPEERGFSPHLTLGRVRPRASDANLQKISRALEQLKVGDIGGTRVEAIHLFKSDLEASGPAYTKLFSAPFGAG